MKVSIPAIRGVMGKRQYYSIMLSLSEVPHLFKFTNWAECTPELRAQRKLNKSRVPAITRYILDNEDSYLFSSITASYSPEGELRFVASSEGSDVGLLEIELQNMTFVINDGQHRAAAIEAAVRDNPAIGKDKINVLLFEMENLERVQQMFTDLNRYAHKTSKSLDVLYDHRDNLSALTMDVSESVDVFKGMVDKENISIPIRSEKLVTLSTLYDANEELLGDNIPKKGTAEYNAKLKVATQFWSELSAVMLDWKAVKGGDLKAPALRQEKINTHAIVMRALGGVGKALIEAHPDDWTKRLGPLRDVDWRKATGSKVNPLWDNVCITAGSVVSNRQARVQTLAVLKKMVGLTLAPREEKLLERERTTNNGPAAARA